MLLLENILSTLDEIPKIVEQNAIMCEKISADLKEDNLNEAKSNLAMFDQQVAGFITTVGESIVKTCPLKLDIVVDDGLKLFYTIPGSEKLTLVSFLSIHEDGDVIPLIDAEANAVQEVKLTRLSVIRCLQEHEQLLGNFNRYIIDVAKQAEKLHALLKADGYDFDERLKAYDKIKTSFESIKDIIVDFYAIGFVEVEE